MSAWFVIGSWWGILFSSLMGGWNDPVFRLLVLGLFWSLFFLDWIVSEIIIEEEEVRYAR